MTPEQEAAAEFFRSDPNAAPKQALRHFQTLSDDPEFVNSVVREYLGFQRRSAAIRAKADRLMPN